MSRRFSSANSFIFLYFKRIIRHIVRNLIDQSLVIGIPWLLFLCNMFFHCIELCLAVRKRKVVKYSDFYSCFLIVMPHRKVVQTRFEIFDFSIQHILLGIIRNCVPGNCIIFRRLILIDRFPE